MLSTKTRTFGVNSLTFLAAGTILTVLVPIVSVALQYDTFIHPWRPELVIAIFLTAFLVWCYINEDFQKFLQSISRTELYAILLPMAVFIIWSFLSALWANSWRSTIHHSTVWVCYLTFYLLARYHLAGTQAIFAFTKALLGLILLLCVPPIIEFYGLSISGTLAQIGGRYSKYTELLNVLLPLAAVFSLRSKGRMAILGVISVALICLLHFATARRAPIAILGLQVAALGIVIFVVPRYRHLRKKFLTLSCGVLIILVSFQLLSMAFSSGVPIVERGRDPLTRNSDDLRSVIQSTAIEMAKANPVFGVGADNFGQEYQRYRPIYAAKHADDAGLAIAESQIAQRAHNEYLQIFAELGIVGFAIFAWFIAGIGFAAFTVLKRRFRVSLFTIAAFISMGGFLISSLVTSFSFRLVQNGIVFFIALAVAVGGSIGKKRVDIDPKIKTDDTPTYIKGSMILAMAFCLALAAYSVTAILAVHYAIMAGEQSSIESAQPFFEKAIRIDPENGAIHSFYGMGLLNSDRPQEAAISFRNAVERGQITSIDYSYLATAQILSGDRENAASAISEALRLYPDSVFLRTRYAVLLKDLGLMDESAAEFEKAKAIDRDQALSWWNLIDHGTLIASRMAFDGSLPPLMDLRPQKAVYAIKAERELRFPEEKIDIPGFR